MEPIVNMVMAAGLLLVVRLIGGRVRAAHRMNGQRHTSASSARYGRVASRS